MTSVMENLRRVAGRAADVVEQVSGLEQAVQAGRGKISEPLIMEAEDVVERAAARLRLSEDHTVVALAGATGSGKSSLFNALVGLDLAAVGVRRPTTSWALACAWGPEGADGLLEWLGIPKRHQVSRMSMLDETAADRDLSGLVLLDLPDHDSTEVAHHLEVQRLVRLADVMIWVLDPQKYADAAVHDRFLRPMSTHADVMLILLNHVDEIPPENVNRVLTDVRRLLDQDGLGKVKVMATSATRGDGLDELRRLLVKRVADKRLARERLSADVRAVAGRMAAETGQARPGGVGAAAREELLSACADAAGVPVVVHAVESASLLRARSAVGWPVTKWLSRFRPDPLKRLHLDGVIRPGDRSAFNLSRTSLPKPTSVQRARVDAAVRGVVNDVTADMAKPWANAIRVASVARLDDISDALDQAVARTDLGLSKDPWWWNGVRYLQWLLFLAGVVGAVWLGGLAVFTYLRLPEPPTMEWEGFPVPTLLLLGGALGGLVVSVLARFAARRSAARRARRAGERMTAAISEVTDQRIVAPMQQQIEAYNACRAGLERALKR